MLNVDTRNNSIIPIIAAGALALVIVLSLVGIIILSVAHDGQLSGEAMDTFKQILLGGAGLSALMGVVERITTSMTASKAISAGANVQGSPVSVTSSPADVASDLGGVSLPGDADITGGAV